MKRIILKNYTNSEKLYKEYLRNLPNPFNAEERHKYKELGNTALKAGNEWRTYIGGSKLTRKELV